MGSIFERNISLKPYNTFKVGGTAQYLTVCYHLQQVIDALQESNFKAVILGRGSNVLISDYGYAGHIIINRAEKVFIDDGSVLCYSGLPLSKLSAFYASNSFSGMEWAGGIPGTVGGATIMNAGAFGSSFSDSVIEALICSSSLKRWVSLKDCNFGYRSSGINGVCLALRLKYSPSEGKLISERAREYAMLRSSKQPVGASAGSVFKAGERAAGWYIENAGLKGFRVGGACISAKHANFIINDNGASAADIKQIIDTVKGVVLDKFQVKLYEEIKYLGEF